MSSPRFHMTYAPQFAGENFAQFIVNTESEQATDEIIKEYSEKYVDHFANVFVRFKQLSFSDAASPIEIRISDGTDESRKVASDKVKNYLRSLPGVYLVRSSYGEPLSGIKVSLDENASKLGVNQFSLEAMLASRYNAGFPIATLWEGNKNVPVVLKGTHADSASFSDLENEKIATYGGLSNAPLRQIAKFSPVFNEGARDRRNGLPTVTISAEVSSGVSANDLALKHFESLKKLTASEGVKLELGGEAASVIETLPGLLKGLVVAVAMMFFIMVWHFRKIRIAFMLFSLLSLSIFGTGVAMWITDMDFTITGVLGMVSLFGIMVRNGIIMIDYAEELKRKEHLSPKNAIYNSALRRMRPIFLTSAAASAGVLPMMVSGDGLWVPMAIIIFWGTLVTMCLILTVLPVAYWGVSCMKFRRRKVISG
jgi:multidrug efflux pump subunit AcrB